MVTTILLRIPLAYGFAYLTRCVEYPNGRPEALFVSLLISRVMGARISCVFLRHGKWHERP